MKDLKTKMFGWMKVNNRPVYIRVGNSIFVAGLIVFTLIGILLLYPMIQDYSYEGSSRLFVLVMIQVCVMVFVAMCTVEYIQERMGCKWNWLNIAAGCFVPVCITVFTILLVFLTF